MNTRLTQTGEQWLDASFGRPPAQAVLDAGYVGIVGYVSRPPSDPAKNITKAECETYLTEGVDVGLVWEMSATTASKGRDAGLQHGEWAGIDAAALGFPVDCVVIAADDTNATALNIDAQEAYMRGFDETCPNPHGVYGDVDIAARIADISQLSWVTVSAWAWSSAVSQADAIAKATALGAHVLQYRGFALDGRWNVDPNRVIRPFTAWTGRTVAPPVVPPINTPPQKDRDMITNKQALNVDDINRLKAKGLLEPGDSVDPATGVLKAHGGFWNVMEDGRLRHMTDADPSQAGWNEVKARGGEAQAVEVDTDVILSFTRWTVPTGGGSQPFPTSATGRIGSVPGDISITFNSNG